MPLNWPAAGIRSRALTCRPTNSPAPARKPSPQASSRSSSNATRAGRIFVAAFDLVLMLCEGGFSLMETDAMNFAILENAVQALRPGGKFLFTCLNGLFPLAQSVKDFVNAGPSGVSHAGHGVQPDHAPHAIAGGFYG